jgi:hypothetical protein
MDQIIGWIMSIMVVSLLLCPIVYGYTNSTNSTRPDCCSGEVMCYGHFICPPYGP